MKGFALVAGLALGLLALEGAQAEKVDMGPEALRKTATHVVLGRVAAIYVRKVVEGDWAYSRYCAEVAVEEVEKGEEIAAGGLVYVRYWTRSWRRGGDTMPTSTAGHRGLPAEGERLRIYLARNAYDGFSSDNRDGGFNVIGANGFERP